MAFTPDRELSSQIWYPTKSQTVFPVLVLQSSYLFSHASRSSGSEDAGAASAFGG